MALQVWLPLNGNLNNQGLTGSVTVTNHGATVNSSGKIGSCYSFTTSQYMELNNISFSNLNAASVCFWVKIAAEDGNWLPFTGQSTSYYILATSGGTGNFYHQNAGSGTIYCDGVLRSSPINDGKWHHYCITNVNLSTWTKFYINYYGSTGSGWNFNGQMNDIRIYDHCLTPKEVHSISQALILHYKLDDMYSETTTNLGNTSTTYSNQTEGNAYTASSWGGDAGTVTYYKSGGYNNGPYKVYHKIATGTGGIYRKTANDITIVQGKTYTMSIYVKASRDYTDSTYSFNINGVTSSDSNHYITASSSVHFTTEWTRIERTFTASANDAGTYGEMSIIYNDNVTDYYVYFSCFQIEEKDHATPFVIGTRNGTIFDDSGYQNDGNITGTLQIVNSEARYRKCGLFNGSSNNIISSINGYNTTYTFVVWAKFNKFSVHLLDCRNSNEVGYQPMYVSNGGVQAGGSATGFPTINYSFSTNTWYHIAVIYSTNKCILYVNGNKIGEASSGYGYNYETNLTIHLGSRLNNTNWFSGNISDFRIYATALSAEDVKSLYNVGAIIDNGANMHTYEYHEIESTTPKVHRTGVTDSSAIIEPDTITNASFSKAGIIKAKNFYEI